MAVTRKLVRDGVIVAEQITVRITDNDTPADVSEQIAGFADMAAFQSAEQRIAAHRAAAQDILDSSAIELRQAQGILDSCAIDPRKDRAESAVRRFDSTLNYLSKITEPSARRNAESAIVDLIRAFETMWIIDVKGVEPEIVTGARSRRATRAGNKMQSDAAAKERTLWKSKASTIWAKNSRLSKTDVAKKIDANRWSYIRKHI